MPRYRLTTKHYADGRLYDPGDEVDWPYPPTPDMVPLDDDAAAELRRHHPRGWHMPITNESLPGGVMEDGSTVDLQRPVNQGAPLTRFPPQPDLTKEIPFGTRGYLVEPVS